MKKTILAIAVLTLFAVPAYAGGYRVSANFNRGVGFNRGFNFNRGFSFNRSFSYNNFNRGFFLGYANRSFYGGYGQQAFFGGYGQRSFYYQPTVSYYYVPVAPPVSYALPVPVEIPLPPMSYAPTSAPVQDIALPVLSQQEVRVFQSYSTNEVRLLACQSRYGRALGQRIYNHHFGPRGISRGFRGR